MATPEVTSIVVDAIVAAFDADPKLFSAFLKRARLETELAQIESAKRKAQAVQAETITKSETDLQAIEAQRQAKLAEIDAL